MQFLFRYLNTQERVKQGSYKDDRISRSHGVYNRKVNTFTPIC